MSTQEGEVLRIFEFKDLVYLTRPLPLPILEMGRQRLRGRKRWLRPVSRAETEVDRTGSGSDMSEEGRAKPVCRVGRRGSQSPECVSGQGDWRGWGVEVFRCRWHPPPIPGSPPSSKQPPKGPRLCILGQVLCTPTPPLHTLSGSDSHRQSIRDPKDPDGRCGKGKLGIVTQELV